MISKNTSNQVELYVGTLLLDNEDRVYLIKEDDRNKISKGRWNLPGGAVEFGEDLITAAKRTAKKETGYIAEVESLIGNYKCTKVNKEWVYIVFGARVLDKKQQKQKISEHVFTGRWFSKGEITHMGSTELVHPDMQLVYNIASNGEGVSLEAVKYIDYNIQ